MSSGKTKIEKGMVCWLILLMTSLGIACWFLGQFAHGWWGYHQLQSEKPAQVNAWGIEEVKKGKFAVFAKYQFELSDHVMHGRTQFKMLFDSQAAAKSYLNDWKNQSWTVFYDANQPAMSTLQRPFPLKVLVSGLLALGISFYFLYLRRFILSFSA